MFRHSTSALVLPALLLLSASCLRAQAPAPGPVQTPVAPRTPVPAPTRGPSPVAAAARATSVTLAQIVARQKANYDRIRNAQGQVSWTEQRAGGQAAAGAPDTRVIYFAFEPEKSVNLVLPAAEAALYAQNQGRINWPKVLSAVAIEGDTVQTISQPAGARAPEVRTVLFNPAVHEANPLVAFHPRLLGEDRVTLAELAATAPRMASPPRITETLHGGQTVVRVDFANPAVPGEAVYYILDPGRAYLPLEIGRISGGRLATRIQLTLGHTKDGTWLPARREKLTFDAAGQTVARESWHYDYLAVNEGLSRKGATLTFFQLPQGTRFISPKADATQRR